MLLNVLQTKLYIVLSDAIMLHDIQRKARLPAAWVLTCPDRL